MADLTDPMFLMMMFRAFLCVVTVLFLGYVLLTKNKRGPIFARFWSFIAAGMLLFTLVSLSAPFGHTIYSEAVYAISLAIILYAYFDTLKDSLSNELNFEQELKVPFTPAKTKRSTVSKKK